LKVKGCKPFSAIVALGQYLFRSKMGRIQKKKKPEDKKKKKQRPEIKSTDPTIAANDGAATKAVSAEETAKENKKRPLLLQRKPSETMSSVVTSPKDSVLGKVTQFLREVKVELKKVTWPSRKQTIGSTAVVIALVMLISFFLGMVDLGLSNLIGIVLR
jgi:preprotein translocase subunit SecE